MSILGPLSFSLYINDMPDSLRHTIPSLYVDVLEMCASLHDLYFFVEKVNIDLENIRNDKYKLQIHPNESK